MGYKDPEVKRIAQKRWRDANYIELKKKQRAYYQANRERICAEQRERKRNMAPEKLREQRNKTYQKHREREVQRYHATRVWLPWLNAFRGSKQRARKRNTPFTITKEWCANRWTGRCEVTNIEFILSIKRSPYLFSPSLDQIITGLGYTPENSRFVLHAVNALKGEGTDEDMLVIARAIIEKLEARPLQVKSVKPAD